MKDVSSAYGVVRVVKYDQDDNIVYDRTFKNQLTNYSRQQSASLWAGTYVNVPSQIAVGTGSPPSGTSSTTANDTTLWNELSGTRKALDYATTFLQYYTQYSVTYNQSEAIDAITADNPTGSIALTEAGLFDADGNLWSHVMLSDVTHDNTTTLSIQWQILHQGN